VIGENTDHIKQRLARLKEGNPDYYFTPDDCLKQRAAWGTRGIASNAKMVIGKPADCEYKYKPMNSDRRLSAFKLGTSNVLRLPNA
jgi:hypothetical protein